MRNNFLSATLTPRLLPAALLLCLSITAFGQKSAKDSTVAPAIEDTGKVSLLQPVKIKDTSKNAADQYFTLQQCIDYALLHQPSLNIAKINIEVAHTNNAINLSTALPQISVNATLTHFLQQSGASQTTTID